MLQRPPYNELTPTGRQPIRRPNPDGQYTAPTIRAAARQMATSEPARRARAQRRLSPSRVREQRLGTIDHLELEPRWQRSERLGKGGVTIAYSQCMRSHGVPNFPDPNSQGVIEGKSSSGSGGSGLNPNSPTYQAAQNTCQKYASGGNTPADQAQQLKQALKFTACMRAHGVPNFPDPTVVNGQIEFDGTSGVGRTPDFPSAQSRCQSLLAEGSGS